MKAVKWGVVGFGEQARKRMIPALKRIKDIELRAVCCSGPESAELAENELGVKCYGKLSEFLSDPEIQVVYIATPHHLHTPQAYKAIEAGKNVLVEKPIALSVDGAHKLTEAARRKNLILGTCFPLRHHPCLRGIQEEIRSGLIGELIQAYVYLSRGKIQEKDWWKDQFHSGPMCLMDLGLYGIDLLLWLAGKRALEVFAFGKGGQSDTELNTSVVVSLNFEGDGIGVVSANNLIQGQANLIVIQGTKEQITIEINWPEGDSVFKLRRNKNGVVQESWYEPLDLYQVLVDNFNQAVQGIGSYSPCCEESYSVVEASCAAIESMKSGRTIKAGEIQRVKAPAPKYKE